MRSIQTTIARSLAQTGAGRALPRNRAALDGLREQLATGTRIQRASDDPAGYSRAETLRLLEGRLAQHERGIGAARLWTDQTQAELDGLSELFTRAYETGLRAANGVFDPEDLAREVESLRDEAITRLNATSGGESLFAGNETGTAPIAADGTIAPGDFSGRRTREVAPGVTLALNVPGTDALVVDGLPAPEQLQGLADAIRSGDPAAMEAAIGAARAGSDHYTELGGRVGTVVRQIQNAEANVEAQAVVAGEGRADIEEIDLAEVLGAIERRQTGLEAALRATATAVQTSLLDYLR